jgi:hypothetical protein
MLLVEAAASLTVIVAVPPSDSVEGVPEITPVVALIVIPLG